MLDAGGHIQTESVSEALRRVTRVLRGAGIDDAAREARLLLSSATGLQATDLICRPRRVLSEEERADLDRMAQRRRGREPVSRILGQREFYGRSFAVTPATLDPRPDSETVIEMALALVDEEERRDRPLRILDIGTGSGCLLITLLAELPLADGVGTDISTAALEVAAQNARQNRVVDRVKFETRRSLKGVDETFDLLVCNPPYIASGEIAKLDTDVRAFDPREALDGGADGLDVYREIIGDLDRVVPRGWAVFEVGAQQADKVAELLRASKAGKRSGETRVRHDLGGHPRCVAMEIQL